MIALVVRGLPAPMGSKRAFVNKHTGRASVVESSKNVKPWRQAVVGAAMDLRAGHSAGLVPAPLDGPLMADMVFSFVRPKSHYRTGRNAHLLKDDAPARPQGTPDLSKLARSTEDALTDARVYVDDARIVEYGRLAKVWCGEDVDALDTPGAVIRVWPYTATGPAAVPDGLDLGAVMA